MRGQVKNSHDRSSRIFKAKENDLLRLRLLEQEQGAVYLKLL